MSEVTPLAALLGGALIGLSALLLLLGHGRIAGITGIFAGILQPVPRDVGWRALFLAGLVAAGVVASFVAPDAARMSLDRSGALIAVAGMAVGMLLYALFERQTRSESAPRAQATDAA